MVATIAVRGVSRNCYRLHIISGCCSLGVKRHPCERFAPRFADICQTGDDALHSCESVDCAGAGKSVK